MKIAITHSRFAYVGGSEKYIYFLVQHLLQQGFEIHYYCHYRKDLFEHPRLYYHHVPMVKGVRFLKALSFILFLDQRLSLKDYHIVHGFYKTFRQDIYTDGNGLLSKYHEYVLSQKKGLARIIRQYSLYHFTDRLFEKLRFQRGNYRRILCMSRLVKEQLQSAYSIPESRIQVLYNAIDCDVFHPRHRPQGISLRKQWGLSPHHVVFTLVGNDYQRKNVSLALFAFRHVTSPRARLVIVGRDKNRKHYEDMAKKLGIQNRVFFAGPVKETAKVYSASDVLLLPSHFDAFGMVVLEAMASGIPVIVSPKAGASEVVEPGTGIVLKALEEAPLSQAMEMLLEEKIRKEWGEKARQVALRYSWPRHMEKLLTIYREVAEEKAKEGLCPL